MTNIFQMGWFNHHIVVSHPRNHTQERSTFTLSHFPARPFFFSPPFFSAGNVKNFLNPGGQEKRGSWGGGCTQTSADPSYRESETFLGAGDGIFNRVGGQQKQVGFLTWQNVLKGTFVLKHFFIDSSFWHMDLHARKTCREMCLAQHFVALNNPANFLTFWKKSY